LNLYGCDNITDESVRRRYFMDPKDL